MAAQLKNAKVKPAHSGKTSNWRAASISQANAYQESGDFTAAERIYVEILQHAPSFEDALHYLGVLRLRQNRVEEASELIERVVAEHPTNAAAHNNLGNVHRIAGRLPQAQSCYQRTLALVPEHLGAARNLASVLESLGEIEQARKIHFDLIARFPQDVELRYQCAMFVWNTAQSPSDFEAAADLLREVLRRNPAHTDARLQIRTILYQLDRPEEAAAVCRDWLALEPDNPIARHMLAANEGLDVPLRADDEYIRREFDDFADRFDEQLVNQLAYVAPQRLHAALAAVLDAPSGALQILDAGCGTGLCGPLFRPYALRLVGVDLSQGMIERANSRGYDRLEVAELGAYLEGIQSTYDLILSADTLVYFGDLRRVLCAAANALGLGGLLGFTLEALQHDNDCFKLSTSGRYQHSRLHVENALAAAGCRLISLESDSLRKEVGNAVPGWVVVARKS